MSRQNCHVSEQGKMHGAVALKKSDCQRLGFFVWEVFSIGQSSIH